MMRPLSSEKIARLQRTICPPRRRARRFLFISMYRSSISFVAVPLYAALT
jgi:hypothetical protein